MPVTSMTEKAFRSQTTQEGEGRGGPGPGKGDSDTQLGTGCKSSSVIWDTAEETPMEVYCFIILLKTSHAQIQL